jgi:hypothetical protein
VGSRALLHGTGVLVFWLFCSSCHSDRGDEKPAMQVGPSFDVMMSSFDFCSYLNQKYKGASPSLRFTDLGDCTSSRMPIEEYRCSSGIVHINDSKGHRACNLLYVSALGRGYGSADVTFEYKCGDK